MILDIAFKLARKYLNNSLYEKLRSHQIGRGSTWDTPKTYYQIFCNYRDQGLNFKNKTVLEVGPGMQFYTAALFLGGGAKEVLLVDPKIKNDPAVIQNHGAAIQQFSETSLIAPEKIKCFHDLSEIPPSYNLSVDISCSHFVLEHFLDLQSYFRHVLKLGSSESVHFNRVDLSDHSYHVFDRFHWSRPILDKRCLYHLRYTDRSFKKLNDRRIFMNRLLFPVYVELSRKHGLEIQLLSANPLDWKPKIHPDVLSKFTHFREEELRYTSFSFFLHPRK